MNRNDRIDAILAKIDHEAEQGWCSNWADTDETPTALIVTFADGTTRRYSIPRACPECATPGSHPELHGLGDVCAQR